MNHEAATPRWQFAFLAATIVGFALGFVIGATTPQSHCWFGDDDYYFCGLLC